MSGTRSQHLPLRESLGGRQEQKEPEVGLDGRKQRTGASSDQASGAQAEFRKERTQSENPCGALHSVRPVSPGGCHDCRWAFTEGRVGGRVTGGLWEGLTTIQSSDSQPSAQRDLPRGWVSPPVGLGYSLGVCISISFPGRSRGCWFWGHQRTLTPWKGESGSLGLGCWEQGRAALPGRERLAEGLPRMPPVPIPAVGVRGDGEPSAPLRAGH